MEEKEANHDVIKDVMKQWKKKKQTFSSSR